MSACCGLSGDRSLSSSSTSLLSSLQAFRSDAVRFNDADLTFDFQTLGMFVWTPCSRDTDPVRSKLV